MSDRKVIIDVETRKRGDGAADVKKELTGLSDAGSRVEGNLSGSFKKIQASVGRVTGAVGALRNLLTGFGIVAAVTAVVGQFKAIRDSIEEARLKQKELADGLAAIKEEMASGFTAKTVDDLVSALKRANDELDRAEKRRAAETAARRAAEDASSGLDEQRELSAIDPSDPLAAQKSGEIRAKYASSRGITAAGHRLDDTAERSRKLDDDRTRLLEDANAADLEASMLRKDAEREREKASAATLKGNRPVMPPWWKVWAMPEADPDKKLEAEKEAQGITARADKMERDAADASERASTRRKDAGLLLDLLGQMSVERGAAYTGVEQARSEGSAGRREAARATENARIGVLQQRREEQDRQWGEYTRPDRVSSLERERDAIQGQMTSAASERDAAFSRASSARTRASSFRPGIDRENGMLVRKSDVEQAAQRAAQEAAQLNVNLTAKLNALGRELKAVNDKIKSSRDSD